MSKHKRQHRWVIVKNGSALMTYEWDAFFFSDKENEDGSRDYYNTLNRDVLDIWTVSFPTKRDAQHFLERAKWASNEYLKQAALIPEGQKYFSEEQVKYLEKSLGIEECYAEDFEGAYIAKTYNYPYAGYKKKSNRKSSKKK